MSQIVLKAAKTLAWLAGEQVNTEDQEWKAQSPEGKARWRGIAVVVLTCVADSLEAEVRQYIEEREVPRR